MCIFPLMFLFSLMYCSAFSLSGEPACAQSLMCTFPVTAFIVGTLSGSLRALFYPSPAFHVGQGCWVLAMALPCLVAIFVLHESVTWLCCVCQALG